MPMPDQTKIDAHSRLRKVHNAPIAHFNGFVSNHSNSMIYPATNSTPERGKVQIKLELSFVYCEQPNALHEPLHQPFFTAFVRFFASSRAST
jgi:hypothetical protein